MDFPTSLSRKTFLNVLVLIFSKVIILFGLILPFFRNINAIAFTVVFGLILLSIAVYVIKKEGITFTSIGLSPKKGMEAISLIVATWILFSIVLKVILGVEGGLWNEGRSIQIILTQWLIVGLGEELLFRGYILIYFFSFFASLSKTTKYGTALCLSTLIFVIWHIPQRLWGLDQSLQNFDPGQVIASLIPLFFFGLLMCYLFIRTLNIILTGLMHGCWNTPLIGMQNDLMPMVILIILIETTIAFRKIRNKRKKNHLFIE